MESCGITALRTTIKFASPRKTREVQKGDAVQFGVAFSNSEVGAGRLMSSLFAKRLVCLNGMVTRRSSSLPAMLAGGTGAHATWARYLDA